MAGTNDGGEHTLGKVPKGMQTEISPRSNQAPENSRLSRKRRKSRLDEVVMDNIIIQKLASRSNRK